MIADRYDAVKESVRQRGLALDQAVHESAQFTDRLDLMLANLDATADQMRNAEPVAAHPDRIRHQIEDNSALIGNLESKSSALEALKLDARDIRAKAKPDDPAMIEIAGKINTLEQLWDEIQTGTEKRGRTLFETLKIAERFWDELNKCQLALQKLKKQIESVELPAVEPEKLQDQQNELKVNFVFILLVKIWPKIVLIITDD